MIISICNNTACDKHQQHDRGTSHSRKTEALCILTGKKEKGKLTVSHIELIFNTVDNNRSPDKINAPFTYSRESSSHKVHINLTTEKVRPRTT